MSRVAAVCSGVEAPEAIAARSAADVLSVGFPERVKPLIQRRAAESQYRKRMLSRARRLADSACRLNSSSCIDAASSDIAWAAFTQDAESVSSSVRRSCSLPLILFAGTRGRPSVLSRMERQYWYAFKVAGQCWARKA